MSRSIVGIVNFLVIAELFLLNAKGKWGMSPMLPEETDTKSSERGFGGESSSREKFKRLV
jgi:hypothetical protein